VLAGLVLAGQYIEERECIAGLDVFLDPLLLRFASVVVSIHLDGLLA
jgi:hypothetical protein